VDKWKEVREGFDKWIKINCYLGFIWVGFQVLQFLPPEIADRIINNSGLATIQVGQQGTGNTGGVYYEFTGLISDVSYDSKNDSVVTVKGSFVSSGVVTKKISTGSAGS
jgi:hypothetical protein